jgi:outer membrane lipoprotein-sorting protein
VSAPRRLGSLALVLVLAGCAIALPPPRLPVSDEARRAVELLTARWREVSDLRALAEVTLERRGERHRLVGVLLASAPASLRLEALSPFGQPYLLVTVHDGRLVAWDLARNEALVGAATVETAVELLSLPVEPEDLVAVFAGRVAPPRDLRVADVLPDDDLGPSLALFGAVNRQRVWMDFETGEVRQVEITGGRTSATVTYRRDAAGALAGFDLSAAGGLVTGTVRYRSLVLGAGVDPSRYTLTLPKDAKIHAVR